MNGALLPLRSGGLENRPEGDEVIRVHQPVLLREVLDWMKPHAGGRYVDATVGGGGHGQGILEASSPTGQLLGIDRDPRALDLARERLVSFCGRFSLRQGSFRFLQRLVTEEGWQQVDGVLLDLGLSSLQLGDARRGFSFKDDGPLDMRFDPGARLTAEELVNTLAEEELARLLFAYGEERQSRMIAREIVRARPLHSTLDLAEVVERTLVKGRARRRGRRRIHPATRTFQALRIAVNDELEALQEALPQAADVLKPGGRLAVISFHSLEDRIVKQFLRRNAPGSRRRPSQGSPEEGVGPLVRFTGPSRPIRPSEVELRLNPRSRSAKLRVAEKMIRSAGCAWPLREGFPVDVR